MPEAELPVSGKPWPPPCLARACSQSEYRQVGICGSEAQLGRWVEGRWQKVTGFSTWSGGEGGSGVPGQMITK